MSRLDYSTPEVLWEVGATLGEGVLWHAPSASVYFVDIKQQRIHRCDARGGRRMSWDAPAQIGFITPTSNGRWLAGLKGSLQYFDPATGAFTHYCALEPEQPNNRSNDGYVDAQGRLWFGTMDDGQQLATGALYCCGADGVPRRADSHYIITNGPACSPDGATLYHTDTLGLQTFAFRLDAAGQLHDKRVFARFAGRGGHPDGMAVDTLGRVWIAVFGGSRIERYSAEGEYLDSIAMPCSNITKLAFGGPDLRTVFITTARKDLAPAALAQQPLAGALFTLHSEVAGLPAHVLQLGGRA